MVPAFVAPSVMGPPSSPAETSTAPDRCTTRMKYRPVSSMSPPLSVKHPTITVYVPLVGAVAATSDAPVPVALLPGSTPVGDTSRIQGATCADIGALSLHDALPISPCVAVNVHVSRSPR